MKKMYVGAKHPVSQKWGGLTQWSLIGICCHWQLRLSLTFTQTLLYTHQYHTERLPIVSKFCGTWEGTIPSCVVWASEGSIVHLTVSI